ncbi:thiamine pyrophosphate-dependent enzyme [uncultured Enterovirga sp.]|uniref:thiamine pyrophosphate-dependent enzyme n=1 Tax=uncultured Enterovirga sp. TaxID=2026352 RepID=UPI0035C98E91
MSPANLLHRRAVVDELLRDRGDLLVIASLGAPNWDISASGDHPNNFPLWGAMAASVTMGLGLALAQPSRRILVFAGDGEMLMSLGALATVGVQRPANLAIVVLDNERYGETGMQKTHTAAGVDLTGVAKACAIPTCLTIRNPEDVAGLRREVYEGAGPVFATVKIDPEALPFVLPPADGVILATRFRRSVLGEAALYN